MASILSRQIRHEGQSLFNIIEDKDNEIKKQEKILMLLINLLIIKNILTQEEIDDYLESINVMEKLME